MLSEDEKMVKFKLLDMFLFYICLFKKPFKLEFAKQMKNYNKNLELWEQELINKGKLMLDPITKAIISANDSILNDIFVKREKILKTIMKRKRPLTISKETNESEVKKELTSELSSESEALDSTKNTQPKEKDLN